MKDTNNMIKKTENKKIINELDFTFLVQLLFTSSQISFLQLWLPLFVLSLPISSMICISLRNRVILKRKTDIVTTPLHSQYHMAKCEGAQRLLKISKLRLWAESLHLQNLARYQKIESPQFHVGNALHLLQTSVDI